MMHAMGGVQYGIEMEFLAYLRSLWYHKRKTAFIVLVCLCFKNGICQFSQFSETLL